MKRGKSKHFGDLVKLTKSENTGAENAFHSITEKPVWNPENAGGVLDFWFTNFASGKAIWTCTWKDNLYFALKRQFVLVHEKTICVCTWKVICALHLKNFWLVPENVIYVCTRKGNLWFTPEKILLNTWKENLCFASEKTICDLDLKKFW